MAQLDAVVEAMECVRAGGLAADGALEIGRGILESAAEALEELRDLVTQVVARQLLRRGVAAAHLRLPLVQDGRRALAQDVGDDHVGDVRVAPNRAIGRRGRCPAAGQDSYTGCHLTK